MNAKNYNTLSFVYMNPDDNTKNIKKQISDLKEEILQYNKSYYDLDTPTISDSAYDKKIRELQMLEEKYPLFADFNSPTKRVGGTVSKQFAKVKHKVPMLSLANAFSAEEIQAFITKVKKLAGVNSLEFTGEPKFDGLAVELIYENGVFIKGSTRGDGITGEDITANLKTIKTIPKKLKTDLFTPKRIDVRGEVFIAKNDFLDLNNQRELSGESLFANPRNAAAGSLRQLDSTITAKRPLNIYFYSLSYTETPLFLKKHSDVLTQLQDWGFPINKNIDLLKNETAVIEYYKKIADIRNTLPYEIDGVVLKLNDLDLQQQIGNTSKSPRWAIACKFESIQETTVVEDIIIQVGRLGTLTPVAIMKPVNIAGVTVTRATLHNQGEIERKDVRIGDTVFVSRAGDVIPEIVKVIVEKRTGSEIKFQFPTKCPVCGSDVVKDNQEAAIKCTGISCPAQIKRNIDHFVSIKAANIDGLGPKIVEQLVENNVIESVADIYAIQKETLMSLERMGEKSANNLMDSIKKSKASLTLERFIYALGIPHVGVHTAEILASYFESIDALSEADRQYLCDINEIGPIVSQSIIDFLTNNKNQDTIAKFKELGINPLRNNNITNLPFSGKSFVLTGSLNLMSRSQAENKIKELGGRILSSVSKKTDFVITGENPGSKLTKAKDLKIQIIKEQDFIEMLG